VLSYTFKLIFYLGAKMTDKEKRLSEKAKKWFSSKEGAESLNKSVEKAVENNRKFKMRRQISPEILKKPITI
jgi:hypothetical protein